MFWLFFATGGKSTQLFQGWEAVDCRGSFKDKDSLYTNVMLTNKHAFHFLFFFIKSSKLGNLRAQTKFTEKNRIIIII